MSTETSWSYHDHRQDEEATRKQKRTREFVRSAVDAGHEALAENRYGDLREIIGALLSRLDVTTWTVQRYDRDLAGADIEWFPGLLRWVVIDEQRLDELGDHDLERVLSSIEAIASATGVLPSELDTEQPVFEYEHKIGTRFLRRGSSAGGDLETVDPGGDWKATLLAGGQGSGKSTARRTLAEDRIEHGNKVIDLVDLSKAENATYDIPMQDDELRRIREEMGLDVAFEEFDPPDLEILVPLTRELEDARIPYDTADEEYVVRPFTIPACELSFRQLVMLLPHTTDTQQNHLRTAHQRLSRSNKDWTLVDLSHEIRQDPKVQDRVADRIESGLETVQNKSFVRDQKSDYTLSWGEIMRDNETVTAFSVFLLAEKLDKLLINSYLIDSLYQSRHKLLRQNLVNEFPPLTVMMGEMHSVAPRSTSEQDSESTIQKLMVDNLSELFSLMRHVDCEIIADTQKFYRQLDSDVAELFHRVYAFRGQKPDISRIFNIKLDPKGSPEERVAEADDGVCALVGGDISGYKWPIHFAPPRSHHLDAKTDGAAFGFRARELEDEELRPAPWETSIPPRLSFGRHTTSPIEKFFEEHMRKANWDKTVLKKDITEAYNHWAEQNDKREADHNYLMRKVRNHFDLDDDAETRPTIDDQGNREKGYKGLQLTYRTPQVRPMSLASAR